MSENPVLKMQQIGRTWAEAANEIRELYDNAKSKNCHLDVMPMVADVLYVVQIAGISQKEALWLLTGGLMN